MEKDLSMRNPNLSLDSFRDFSSSYRITSTCLFLLLTTAISHGLEIRNLEIDLGVEIKTHFRHSEDNRFPLTFPPGAELRTVDPGSKVDVSAISLFADMELKKLYHLRGRVDFLDLHDRNSTSDDKNIDFDEYWFRIGSEVRPGKLPEENGRNLYVKLGKFGKFERQTDRHLESYGLVSTAFNRFEDLGVELGIDLFPNVYVKGSLTSGNPVFMRDPNALAGDNGTSDLLDPKIRNAKENSGIPLIYDAEVEDLQFDDNFAEAGLGLGYRLGNESLTRTIDLMVFGYERQLKERADLFGTHYGGDLDLFDAPGPITSKDGEIILNGLKSDYKREYGLNIWVYFDEYTLFGQYVEQDIGGLDRKGYEIELSRKFYLPEIWTLKDSQIFSTIRPAIRYSHLNPNFAGPANFPAPSLFWEWQKIDVGFTVGILPGVNLRFEYAFNEFKTAGGEEDNNEYLTTLNWRYLF
jgi:hypothetical protein